MEFVALNTFARKVRTSVLIAFAFMALAAVTSKAATISFSGGFPGFTQLQSDGATPIPNDGSFHFEVGSFASFVPTTENTDQWLANWSPVTDPAGDRLEASTTEFTTLTFGGFATFDGFSGTVELDHNNAPFTAGTQGYVWGFDTRETPGQAQWILMTHVSATPDAWTYPSVVNAPDSTWSVGTANTTYAGSIDGQQMTLGAVIIPGAIPEPSAALLVLFAGLTLSAKRRRPTH